MEFRQLEYLVAIADEASFTRAAERTGVTQPGISAQIKQLETELGQRLFERGRGPVRPTEAGAELLEHARAVLARLDLARESLEALGGLVRGAVTVGTVPGAPLGRMARMLGAFHAAYPGITVALREDGTEALLDGLRSGDLDLALVGLPAGPPPEGIASAVLTEERAALFVGPEHPWRERERVRLADLDDGQPLITLMRGSGVRAAFDIACTELGARPMIALEVSGLLAAVELAHAGLGAALLPEPTPPAISRGLHPVALDPAVISRPALAWPAGDQRAWRPAARALVDVATR